MKLLIKDCMYQVSLMRPSTILMIGSTLLFSQSAFSDATVVYEQIAGTQKILNTMEIKEGKIRFTPPDQNNNYSLYDSKTRSLTHVDAVRKQYLSMDEKAIEEQANQAKQQMDKMREQMMAKMKDMPPEQKKQVEQMMNNHLSRVDKTAPSRQVEQKKTPRTETFAGIQCTVYEVFVSGHKINEICMADPDKLGLSSQDAEALMSMQKFMKRMQKVAQTMMGTDIPSADIHGVPLHTTLFDQDGSIKLQTRLSSITTQTLSADTISIPADYAPMQMPQMPGM